MPCGQVHPFVYALICSTDLMGATLGFHEPSLVREVFKDRSPQLESKPAATLPALDLLKTFLLFTLTALAEIVGCYLPCLWLKTRPVGMVARAGRHEPRAVCLAAYPASHRHRPCLRGLRRRVHRRSHGLVDDGGKGSADRHRLARCCGVLPRHDHRHDGIARGALKRVSRIQPLPSHWRSQPR